MAKSIYGNITPQTFHSAKARRTKFLILFFVAAFWNGFCWFMTINMVHEWSSGAVCPLMFMMVFIVIGAIIIVVAVHAFLALFNPTLELVLDHAPLRLAETVSVTWSFTGRVDRIQRLQICLEGREQSRYRRGTNTHTDDETFLKLDVADTTVTREIASGRTTLEIPAGTMHSFDGGDNKILWRFVVSGEIPARPDVKDHIDVQILPQWVPDGSSEEVKEVPA